MFVRALRFCAVFLLLPCCYILLSSQPPLNFGLPVSVPGHVFASETEPEKLLLKSSCDEKSMRKELKKGAKAG